MENIDPTKRQRVYGFIPVFWAWVGQILDGNQSCTKSVSLIQSWSRSIGLRMPSSDTSAYTRARKRMSPQALMAIDKRIQNHLNQRVQDKDLWNGHQILSIDGTSIRLMDTEENQELYPQPSGHVSPGDRFTRGQTYYEEIL